MSNVLDEDRQNRDEHDPECYQGEVVLDDGNVPEQDARQQAQPHPRGGADRVVEHERRRRHLSRPRDTADEKGPLWHADA